MRILLVGPVPPPIGGVSIHIQRLRKLLLASGCQVLLVDESSKNKLGIFNFRSLQLFTYLKLICMADVVHIHSSLTVFRLFHLFVCYLLRKKYVVTLHSWRVRSNISISVQRFFLARAIKVLCVNNVIDSLLMLDNTIVKPAFLPPDKHDQKALPNYMVEWINKKRKLGSVIFSSNAYRLDEYDGCDLYGLDLAIDMIERLNAEYCLDVCLIFVVANLNVDEVKFPYYKDQIRDSGLADKVLLIHESELSFVSLVESSDITLRATNTDGDALSVRESLYLNKPVIASDAVVRPNGAHIFKSRDIEDLCIVAHKLMSESFSDPELDCCSEDYYEFYGSVYKAN